MVTDVWISIKLGLVTFQGGLSVCESIGLTGEPLYEN